MAGDARDSISFRMRRMWRHRLTRPRQVRAAFDTAAFDRIEAAITEGETRHRGEVRFAVEADLDLVSLWADMTPRERAVEVFAAQGIWDTEENTGVLIYLLWADHAVEIVADRRASKAMRPAAWEEVCTTLARACREGHHVDGVVAAIHAVNEALAADLPMLAQATDELPNRPIRL